MDISITLSRLFVSSILTSSTTMIYGHKHLRKDVALSKEKLLGFSTFCEQKTKKKKADQIGDGRFNSTAFGYLAHRAMICHWA